MMMTRRNMIPNIRVSPVFEERKPEAQLMKSDYDIIDDDQSNENVTNDVYSDDYDLMTLCMTMYCGKTVTTLNIIMKAY